METLLTSFAHNHKLQLNDQMHECASSVPGHQDHDNISAGVIHQESGGGGVYACQQS